MRVDSGLEVFACLGESYCVDVGQVVEHTQLQFRWEPLDDIDSGAGGEWCYHADDRGQGRDAEAVKLTSSV